MNPNGLCRSLNRTEAFQLKSFQDTPWRLENFARLEPKGGQMGALLDSTIGAPVSDPAWPLQIPTRLVGERRSAAWGELAILGVLSRFARQMGLLAALISCLFACAVHGQILQDNFNG